MALMGVFARQPWRRRHREEAYGHRGGGGDVWRERRGCVCISMCKQPVGASHGKSSVDACALACVNRQPVGASHGKSGVDACAPACVNRQPGGASHGESGVDECAPACVNTQGELHMARATWVRVHRRV